MIGVLAATSAPVTNWPLRLALVALVIAVIAGVLAAMRRGWTNRRRRQSDLPQPQTIPVGTEHSDAPVLGVYLGSVMAGDWLDRVVAHGLGTRSRVAVAVTAGGISVERFGARSFFIPARDLVAVRRERGIAGKAFEKDAVVVVTWLLGSTSLDTGFRPDRADEALNLVEAVSAVVTAHHPAGPSAAPTANPGAPDSESTL